MGHKCGITLKSQLSLLAIFYGAMPCTYYGLNLRVDLSGYCMICFVMCLHCLNGIRFTNEVLVIIEIFYLTQ